MNNIDHIIDRARFVPAHKVELKRLATTLLTCKSKAAKLAKQVSADRAAVNERQFSERLRALGDQNGSEKMITMQYAYRNVFVNTLLIYYENFRQIHGAAARIRESIAPLDADGHADTANALKALSLLSDPDTLPGDNMLGEMNKVSGITDKRLRQCVAEIYKHKVSGVGTYAHVNFSSQPIDVFEPDALQQELILATRKAQNDFETYRPNGADFVFAKGSLNRPQFVERLEAALSAGDMAKVALIKAQQKAAEADVYVCGTRLLIAAEIFREQTREFGAVLKRAAEAIVDDGSLASLIAMSNWNGSWHWYHEMEMLLGHLDRYHVRESLDDIYFEIGRGLPI